MSIQLILYESGRHGVPVKIYTTDIEQGALQQLQI